VRTALVLSMILVSATVSHSVDPFDHYIAQVKAYQPSPLVRNFAEECGVALNNRVPKYAVTGTGTWTISRNLPQDVYNLESDSFDTAEMWTGDNGARVLNWWDIDLEQNIDTLFCLDSSGRVRFLEATNWTFRDEDSSTIEWVYKQRRNFDSHGALLSKTGHFEDVNGKPIHPVLTKDDAASFDWVPKGTSLKDFGLEGIWPKN
jgi:hypothetical protein